MKRNFKNFQILVLRDGSQHLQSLVTPVEYTALSWIISTFRTHSELVWFRSEVLGAVNKGERTYVGQNYFYCYVHNGNCELSITSHDENMHIISTEIVLEYIDECLLFVKEFNEGVVPGIIPRSEKNNWVIVPKDYVKEEYWNKVNN